MKVLDLFSGIGGFSLGLERAGMQTVAFCEIDKFCQKVLKKHWPHVPIHEDITKLDGKQYAGTVDLICGGFPCQPFSVAGKQKGKDDNRHLWPEMLRIIKEVQPTWIIGENVPGIINMELEQVCIDLEAQGYEVQALIIPACAVNAPHKRNRVWILAHSTSRRWNGGSSYSSKCSNKNGPGDAFTIKRTDNIDECGIDANPKHNGWIASQKQGIARDNAREGQERKDSTIEFKGMDTPSSLADTEGAGLEGENEPEQELSITTVFSGWETMPRVCGGNNGLSNRVDRIKSLGNAVVPQIPEIIGRYILKVENE